MANISDARGTVTVKKVGEEFLEYASCTSRNYYPLVDKYDLSDEHPDKNGDISITFNSQGRWSYSSNLDYYLAPDGCWHENGEASDLYDKLYDKIRETGGSIVFEYTDFETGNRFIGSGVAKLELVDGEVQYTDDFSSSDLSIKKYSEVCDVSFAEAIESLYSYEASTAWDSYEKTCEKKGEKIIDPDTWLNEVYEDD